MTGALQNRLSEMPNRWESSKRPLFVRTVFVNGNRHAILSQEDPLCQPPNVPTSRKQSRPSSSQSFTSTSSNGSSKVSLGKRFKEGNWEYDSRDQGGRTKNTKITNDLQGCLVKLRLVLETNERRQRTKQGEKIHNNNNNKNAKKCTKMKSVCDNYRQRKRRTQQNENKNCSFCDEKIEKNKFVTVNIHSKTDNGENGVSLKYDDNQNITETKEPGYYYYNETASELSRCCCEKDANIIEVRDLCCCEGYYENQTKTEPETKDPGCDKSDKKFVGNYSRPYQPNVLGENNEWNNVSAESFFTRQIYNPLSERVLQWLDLASKKKAPVKENTAAESEEVERISAGTTFLDENGKIKTDRKIKRSKSEGKIIRVISKELSSERLEKKESMEKDVEEEVKTETDVETVLSTAPEAHVYPKYSSDLNKNAKALVSQKSDTARTISEIPNKEETTDTPASLKLQESITNNFAVANMKSTPKKSNKPANKNKKYATVTEKRSLLMRQPKFQETSDEEEQLDKREKQQELAKMKRNAFSHRNSIFNKTIESHSKTKNDLLARYKEKYMIEYKHEDQEEEKCDRMYKHLQTTQILSSQLQSKIPWLRDYHHGNNGCRNMWPSDKATTRPQLHIFMPAMSPENNPDDSISECESYTGEL